MTVRRPSRRDLEAISRRYHLRLTEAELDDYMTLVADMLGTYDALDQFPDPAPALFPAIREVGARPAPADDPLNGVVRTCRVRAVEPVDGPLSGKTIGVKDTIAIAGIPLTCGSRLLYDYTPDADATIVHRMLAAGGEITHILNTDDFGFAGTGHTSGYGPSYNPVDADHHPGGSSAGSAIAVATGMVDLALGGDQGGSIRIPAAWSGIVGLKPSHGLVPYTGIAGLDFTIDHIGPMTRTVEETALLLGVIAGKAESAEGDAIDPRQPDSIEVQDYRGALAGGAKGLRIGVLEEGFGHEGQSEPEVDEAVRGAAARFEALGAKVASVSIPAHRQAPAIWTAIAVEGTIDTLYRGGMGLQHKGAYSPRLMTHLLRAIRSNGADFSPTAKMGILTGHYVREQYQGAFYARAQNMARGLTAAYDRALAEHDILLMPTTPQRAHARIPSVEEDRLTYCRQALNMVTNTAPIDVTGHPSISIPCADVAGRPIGVMLTGRHMDDATVLRAAQAYMER